MKIKVYNLQSQELPAWDIDAKVLGKPNAALLAQALRIYESNTHQKPSRVKTRGEVQGSTRKIYRQKGTGNARHGAKYAPIFVGGGIAHGPTGVRPVNLALPKRMRRRALASALLVKLNEGSFFGVSGVKSADGKTATAAAFLHIVGRHPEQSVLLVTANPAVSLYGMVQNLQGVTMKRVSVVNAYDLLSHDSVVMTKPALTSLISRIESKISDGGETK